MADHLDARDHAEAIDLLYEDEQKNISSGLLKKLNSLLLCGIRYNPISSSKRNLFNEPVNPGQYKETPNHVVTPSGEVLTYVAPADVPDEIENLINWFEHEKNEGTHPAIIAALTHYSFIRIHPFNDRNGREARLLMNLILMKNGYIPAIIKAEEKTKHIRCLCDADSGNLEPFCTFVADSLIST